MQPGHLEVADPSIGDLEQIDQRSPDTHGFLGIASAEDHGHVLALVGKRGLGVRRRLEHVPDLEQPDAMVPMSSVVGHRLHQPRQQRGPKDRLLGHERIGDLEPDIRQATSGQLPGSEEGHRCRLGESETGQR